MWTWRISGRSSDGSSAGFGTRRSQARNLPPRPILVMYKNWIEAQRALELIYPWCAKCRSVAFKVNYAFKNLGGGYFDIQRMVECHGVSEVDTHILHRDNSVGAVVAILLREPAFREPAFLDRSTVSFPSRPPLADGRTRMFCLKGSE